MVERLLICRVKKRRFCNATDKEQLCFGVCRIAVNPNSDDGCATEMCSVLDGFLDELVNGAGSRQQR